jgi:polar amino acid transport system substrate-binding protein
MQDVVLQLEWKHQFEFAGFYMAKEKGFYKDNDLNVSFKEFDGKSDIIESVVHGDADFGIAYPGIIVDAFFKDDLVLLAAIFQSSPHVFVSLQSSGIHTIEDFKGKSIMIGSNALKSPEFIAMLNKGGVSFEHMKVMEPDFNVTSLMKKKSDLAAYFLTNEIYELNKLGVAYEVWDPKDYGFDFYTNFLFTTKKMLHENPELVEKFTEASLKGWRYALNHIEESVALIMKKYNSQNKSEGALFYEAYTMKPLVDDGLHPIGDIAKYKIKRIIDIYKKIRHIDGDIDVDKLIYKKKGKLLSLKEQKYLQKKKSIRYCVDPNWIPFEAIKEGKHIGLSADYLKLFAKQYGVSFDLVQTKSWKESLNKIKKHQCDILPLAMQTESRKKYLNFTKPYIDNPLVIATKKDEQFIATLDELSQKRVGIVREYAFLDVLRREYPNVNFVMVRNIEDGLKKVKEESLKAYIGPLTTVAYMIQKEFPSDLKIAGKVDMKLNLAVAVRGDDLMLFEIMQKMIENIHAEDAQKILNNWLSIRYEKGVDYALIYKIILIFITLFVIVLYFFMKLKKLHKELQIQHDSLVAVNKLLVEKEQELQELATTDFLTQLYNRRYCIETGEKLFHLAKRKSKPLSVILFDIDNFKGVNDTYGHKIGDAVLVSLALKLSQNSRLSDIVCRFGGEEFIIILPDTTLKESFYIAAKLRQLINRIEIKVKEDKVLKITVSMGISTLNYMHDESIEDIIKRADEALYVAKNSGKDRIEVIS